MAYIEPSFEKKCCLMVGPGFRYYKEEFEKQECNAGYVPGEENEKTWNMRKK